MNENEKDAELFVSDGSDFFTEEDFAADQPEAAEVEKEESGEGESGAAEDGASGTETGEETADQPDDGASGEKFHLKWMDEERDVTKEEIVPLAQKGLDYDRVKGKLEESRQKVQELGAFRDKYQDVIDDLEDFVKDNKLNSMAEALDAMRIIKLTQAGVNRDVATARVKQSRAERALAKATAPQTAQQTADTQMQSKAQKDLQDFRTAHPDVNLNELLPKLKDDLEKTQDLERAWLLYENRRERAERERLEKELKAERQNKENKKSSPGSMASSGGDTGGEKDFAYWLNYEG